MSVPANLLLQPEHVISQRARKVVETRPVRISSRQDKAAPKGSNAQRAGMRYEARIGKKLHDLSKHYPFTLHDHVWIDANGTSYQPDFFLTFPSGAVILFEVKQTWVDTKDQLRFYKHLLMLLGFGPITTCTICRNLTPLTPRKRLVRSFDDITEGAIWPVRV